MRFALVQQGIQHVREQLSNSTQTDNIQVQANDKCISWRGRSSGIQRDIYYPLEYQYLLDRQQYSILLSDASFLQLYYQFDCQDKLKAARLAYFPPPIQTIDSVNDLTDGADAAFEREDELLFEHLYNSVELLDKNGIAPTNTSHIRFDFDKSVQSHAPSHLQFGGIQDFRIPCDFVPQPLAFVQLCESLISGCKAFDITHINFAKNNRLDVDRTKLVISLGTLR